MQVKCFDCGNEVQLSSEMWRCSCGGGWEPAEIPTFNLQKVNKQDFSIWRYGQLMGLDVQKPLHRMGVGWTPIVPIHLYEKNIYLKLEYLSPSGSFKDRGVNAMVNQLAFMGISTIVEDSSGNAGASLAAHAARFGMEAEIFVPEYASQAKKQQISVYGANVRQIQGSRTDVEEAAQAEISPWVAYASHAYHPAYLAGQVTAAYEVWEQLGRKAPDWILLPVAQGGQFLGYWFGFQSLFAKGLIQRMPHLVAVQSARIAPIYHAWRNRMDDVPGLRPFGPTIAEGVAINKPVRGKRILQAINETDGRVLPINEPDILEAQELCAKSGYFIEPTSALVIAGLRYLLDSIDQDEIVLLPLTGNGLKGIPQA